MPSFPTYLTQEDEANAWAQEAQTRPPGEPDPVAATYAAIRRDARDQQAFDALASAPPPDPYAPIIQAGRDRAAFEQRATQAPDPFAALLRGASAGSGEAPASPEDVVAATIREQRPAAGSAAPPEATIAARAPTLGERAADIAGRAGQIARGIATFPERSSQEVWRQFQTAAGYNPATGQPEADLGKQVAGAMGVAGAAAFPAATAASMGAKEIAANVGAPAPVQQIAADLPYLVTPGGGLHAAGRLAEAPLAARIAGAGVLGAGALAGSAVTQAANPAATPLERLAGGVTGLTLAGAPAEIGGAAAERAAPVVRRLGEYGTAVARESGLGPELGVIKRDLASSFPGPVRLPTDPAELRLLQGQRDIRLTADGLEVDLRRYQKPVQVGADAPYVFYSPRSVASDKYRTFSPYAGEGGSLGVQGTTVFQRPLVVEAFGEGTGVGPAVVEKLLPDGAARAAELGRAARGAANDVYSPSSAMATVLREWGGYSQADSYAVAQQIITNYDSGFPRRFALMDAVGARLARAAGYDGVLYGRRGRIEEVMELREATYPGQRYRSTIRSEYQTGEQATAPLMNVADREAALTAVEQRLDAVKAQIAQRHAEGVPAEFPPYGGQYEPDSWAAARHAEWQDLKGQVRTLEEQRLRLRATPAAAAQPESTTAPSGQPGGIVTAPATDPSFPALVVAEPTARVAPAAGDLPATSGIIAGAGATQRMYHGTGTTFATPEPAKFDPNGLYGPGYYLTDEPRVAAGYATGRAAYQAPGGPLGAWATVTAERDQLQELVSRHPSPLLSDQRAQVRGRIQELDRQLDELVAQGHGPLAGPQIRPVDVPEGLRLLDTTATVPYAVARQVLRAAGIPQDYQSPRLLARMEQAGTPVLGQRLYDWLDNSLDAIHDYDGRPPIKQLVNKSLAAAGYDGIRYPGGQIMPLTDDAGKAIEHTAVVIFPESLPKLTNAFSGQPGGIVAAPAQGTSFPSLLRAAAGNPDVSPVDLAAGRLGAVVGGVTGYQTADENATPQERAGRTAMGALLGGAGTVGAVRGGRALVEALPALTREAAEGGEVGILPGLLSGGRGPGRGGLGSPPRLPGPPGETGSPAAAPPILGGQVGDPDALRRFQSLDQPTRTAPTGVGEWLTRIREASQDEFVRLTQLDRYRPSAARGEPAAATASLALRPELTTPGTPAAATVQEAFAQSRQLEDGLVSRWSNMAEHARPPGLPPPTGPQLPATAADLSAGAPRATIHEVPPSGPTRLPPPALPPQSPPVVVAAERESSHNLALRFAGVRGQADVILMTELRPLLRATIAEGNTVEDLNTLLRIRQVAELTRRGFLTPGGMTIQDAEGAALALRARLGPERFAALVQRSNALYAWQDRVLLEPARGSLLSGEQIDRFRAANEHYYPHMVMDVSDAAFDAVPVGQAVDLERGGVAQSGYYRRLGSERATMPPLEAMVQRVYTRLARLEKNRVAQALVADLQDVDPSLAVLKQEGQVARTGQGELSLLRDGVKETYLVPTEVAQTAQHLDRQQANILVRALGAVNAVSRAGYTALNPNFAVRNAIRDPLEAFYREGLAPFGYHHVKGLLSALVQDADWEAYLRSRAGIGGLFEGGAPAETVSRLAASPTQRFIQTVSNPLELIRRANEVLEQGTRIGVFTQRSGRVQGPALPGRLAGLIGGPTTATVGEAAVTSRQSTVDFGNGGYLTKALNPIILFANANAQGFYNVVEPLLQRSPAERLRAAARLAILGTAAAAAFSYNRLWHYSDGRSVYDDVPLYDRDHNIVLLYGIGRDPQGREVPAYFKPPKPQVVKGTWNLIEEGLRWAEGKSQRGLGELSRAMVDWMSPIPTAEGVIPPALKTPLEIAQNRDWFRQRELETERERRVPAGQRLRPTTSPAAVVAARGLEQLPLLKELSPIQLQHLLEGIAGGGGRVGLQSLSAALGAAGLTPEGTGGPPLVPPSTEVAASRLPVAAGVLGAQGGQLAQEERDRLEQQRQTLTAHALRSLLRTEAYQRAPAAVQQQVRERVAAQIDARFANARRAITVPPARP